jgi:hypothetical protein
MIELILVVFRFLLGAAMDSASPSFLTKLLVDSRC